MKTRAESLKLVEEMESRVAAMSMEDVETHLASLTSWRKAVAKAKGPVDRRSLLVDILYLDLIAEE